jgi:hypothetical protein
VQQDSVSLKPVSLVVMVDMFVVALGVLFDCVFTSSTSP